MGEDEPGKRAGPVRPALPSPRGEGLADRIETRRHGKVLHCRDPPVGDVWARFYGGSCRQYGACAPYPLLYSLFAATSNTAICALCISAALGRFAGVRITGAIMQAVVILQGCHGAGASAIGLIGARLAQAVGAFVGFIESAYLFHGLHLTGRHSARGAGQEPRAPRRACRWPYLFIWPDIRRFALLVGLLATSRPSGPAGAWLLMISDSGKISPSSNFFCKLSTTANVS